jgi:hypothetical protein
MSPRVKYALIVGSIGSLINLFVSVAFGLCGPGIALLVGGIAGFLAAQAQEPRSKGDGGRAGAVAGAIGGGIMLVAQVLASLIALMLTQFSGLQPFGGGVPARSDPLSLHLIYYLSGLGVGLCFGVADVIAAALAGTVAGYLNSSNRWPQAAP